MFHRLSVLSALLAAIWNCGAQQFLPKDTSALINLLPPFPTEDSPAGRADLETVLQVQADRTPKQIARAKRVEKQTVSTFAQAVFGEWFQIEDFPRTKELFEEFTREDRSIVNGEVKARWNRTRPYLSCTNVHPVVERPHNTSYPSGHSALATVWGTIFSAAFPDKAEAFAAQVREVMWCRVIGGAHYPSDTAAGRMLGEAMAKAMLKSPEMESALKTIREEITPAIEARSKTAAVREPALAK